MRKILLTLPVAALVLGTAAYADGMETVKARHAYFKSLGGAMKAMSGVAKSYDAEAAKAEAAKLAAILETDAGPLFAPGTSADDFPGESEAKASIWENMDDFGAKAKAMHVAGAELIAAADTGEAAAFGAALKTLGGTCKACHDDYRVPE
ncbi:cytochrome c556 [Rhodobacter sp. JA431]|uniref:c-type cytochrome n=1 Tax=Rhodobacter sp. JA431 TaxID=570013 RepID=UPI000BDB3783|nr:cytochrome c [Rhodobacter sp. JA431]SOB93018.1 cytochrome c556 [Rhodobacter sp. JA431]